MKKTLLTFLFAVATVVAMAQTKTYTDNLLVKVGENNADPQVTTIFVEQNNDGTYTLSLNNFILTMGEEVMNVGNIVVNNISVTEEKGIKSFDTTQSIMITPGNDENVAADEWMEFEDEVTITLTGKMDAAKLYCNINIDMGFPVNVVFGDEKAVTNIDRVAAENDANVIYDLTGRKVNSIEAAGIYIVNGKKVLVK